MTGFVKTKSQNHPMKINSIDSTHFKSLGSTVKNIKNAAADSFAKIDNVGEGTNIALDFLGKAILVPATIMIVSKEDKEKKEYSALKNPVAAVFQLMMEAPILIAGSNFVGKLANKGALDKAGSGISYNENLYRGKFILSVKNAAREDENFKTVSDGLLEKLNKKGLGKNLRDDFYDIIEQTSAGTKESLKKSLKDYDTVHKRLYHLQNRVCFVAAIALTPLLCKAEDYFFPKIMNLIKPNKQPSSRRRITLQHFRAQTAKGGLDD